MHAPLEITRTFPASVNQVFELFASEKHLANWWGPKGMDLEIKTFEFVPEGIFHYLLKAGNGFEM